MAESKETQPAGEAQRKGYPTVSRRFDDGTLIELMYGAEGNRTAFAVWQDGHCSIETDYTTDHGERLVPFSPHNNLIKNEVVLLPSEPQEYGSEEKLLADIHSFIHCYADLSPSFEKVATYYVVLSWLYDAFNEMPYLRLRGDFGTGKTRTLLTIGSLCYKGFFASGASTVSPIFHTLDAFGGTLIFDEADFRFSDEKAEIVKVLNNGNVRGMPVLRTMMNRQREFNPQAFKVFGPKIVGTRSTYEDKGLESRFITEEMGGRALRTDIPINLPPTFKDEAREIRNMLLLYRFRRRHEVKLDESLIDPALEPRLNQILLPLLSVIGDPELREELRLVALKAQSDLVTERGYLPEALVLETLSGLMSRSDGAVIPIGQVTSSVINRYGSEYDRPITNRWIGGIIRRRLNLVSYKSHGVYVVPMTERSKVELLCKRFGIPIESEQGGDKGGTKINPSQYNEVDVGTSGTS